MSLYIARQVPAVWWVEMIYRFLIIVTAFAILLLVFAAGFGIGSLNEISKYNYVKVSLNGKTITNCIER